MRNKSCTDLLYSNNLSYTPPTRSVHVYPYQCPFLSLTLSLWNTTVHCILPKAPTRVDTSCINSLGILDPFPYHWSIQYCRMGRGNNTSIIRYALHIDSYYWIGSLWQGIGLYRMNSVTIIDTWYLVWFPLSQAWILLWCTSTLGQDVGWSFRMVSWLQWLLWLWIRTHLSRQCQLCCNAYL